MVKLNGQNEESTRQKILSAARQEFIVHGLRGARMQEIADRAGINKALLHYHFKDKVHLYKAAVESVADGVLAKMTPVFEKAPAVKTLEEIIETMIRTYMMVLKDNPEFVGMALRELSDGGKYLHALMQRLAPLIVQISNGIFKKMSLQTGGREGLPDSVPHLILNMMSMIWGTFLLQPLYVKILPVAGYHIQIDEAFYEARIKTISKIIQGSLEQGGRE